MTRSPGRFLLWLAVCQWPRVLAASGLASTWMLTIVVTPWAIGRGVDALRASDTGGLVRWSGAVLALAVTGALIGLLRHRTMTMLRMDGAFRTIRTVTGHAVDLGAALPRRVSAGEVVTIGVGDVWIAARSLTVFGPGVAGVVSYAVVAVLLLRVDWVLAVIVLTGVPVLAGVMGPLLRALQRAGARQRSRAGLLNGRLLDIVGGLRLLNGLGGKPAHLGRYRQESAEVLREGYRVAQADSWIKALGTGVPALFLGVVTWIGAHLATNGDITVGQLTSVYGYAAVLALPVETFFEAGYQITAGLVAARRVVALLTLPPDPADGGAAPPPGRLHDPESGVTAEPGQFTALAGAGAGEIVQRLAKYGPTAATWGGVPLSEIDSGPVRDRILLADDDAYLFAGALPDVVAGAAAAETTRADRALYVAAAHDINGTVEANGRNLSGGQRQRVRLARAVYQEPEFLIAPEPTSAVDAHTEAAIAERLAEARRGRGTLVVTTSPVLLDRADVVHFLLDGRVAATGTHRSLMAGDSGYRDLVARS